ncbi:hypothetical protein BFJ68_g15932 [Fusarium oxysporum]|uniref:Uncharacterized protein n=2 Tax=Fusarium oxysporum TaxID=5507 RepID=A0A420PIJ7_FUSOX|nr:hypothetical protein BFJ65_g16591 [Fusarium oxysporum f. sp. cepae]RKK37089.1 hypothetical protein BFJ67_g12541 [Fusarium oxysporum f. sp. cepae]RKK45331.1 hypothetical protein BFJ66_g9098 [Fusarium oxysporum f. sp. cepae]RKK92333.1 hypothetical protein BFJ68_g15932 [Fusarium oxysporum]
MANPNLSGGLIGLPTEIIINVVNALINDANSKAYRFNLEILRLTHQRFANLDFINASTFKSSKLEPTPEGLSKLQHANFSRIARFVRSVTFLSPPSWELPFAAFQGIVQDTMPDEQKGCGDLKQAGAYATYMYHARDSQILLADQCSELRRLWVKTLKLFGGSLREICLLSPRDNDDRLRRLERT